MKGPMSQPRAKKRYKTPKNPRRELVLPSKVRPNGHEYSVLEYEIVKNWHRKLEMMSDEHFGTLSTGYRAKTLRKKGWQEIMPGLWIKNLIGPLRTKDAFQYFVDCENIWEAFHEAIRARILTKKGWTQLRDGRWSKDDGPAMASRVALSSEHGR
jgi:hypothetical protein